METLRSPLNWKEFGTVGETGNLLIIPFYFQSVLVQSADCVNAYAVSCRMVLSSAPL
jgi:hypothetical protein